MEAERMLLLVLTPARLSVRAVPELVYPSAPVLVKFAVLPLEVESVPPLAPMEKRRLEVAPPLTCKVPPSMTRLAASLEELPMPLALPPSARLLTFNTPPSTVVEPEYVPATP